jgi:predicted P-loop ATPase
MFLESLLPERLSTYYFSGVLDPANKDSLSYLAECFFINLDELDSLNRGKEAALKELITKSVIKYRRPYGTFNQNYTRVASFMGSINHEGILSDTSGSRRYLVHKIKSINYRHHLDMDLVYSQAYALYKQGFKYWFAGKDIDRIHAENRKYELSTIEEEMLVKEFEPGSADDATSEKLSATDILKQLHDGKLPPNSTSAAIKLGQALVKQGFTYQMMKGSKKWLVKRSWQTQTKGDLWGG